MTLAEAYSEDVPPTKKAPMQQVLNEVAKRLTSKNPDSDELLAMLDELHKVETELRSEDWKAGLRNVATAYGLEIPECLK